MKVIQTGHTGLMKGLIDLNAKAREGEKLVLECQVRSAFVFVKFIETDLSWLHGLAGLFDRRVLDAVDERVLLLRTR